MSSHTVGAEGQGPVISFHFLTLFPEAVAPFFEHSLLGRARSQGLVSFACTQIRDFSTDKHRTVDDAPYGGGPGMVLRADVLSAAWKSVWNTLPNPDKHKAQTILVSPQGKLFDQEVARELSAYSHLIVVCGHYEGLDERFIGLCVDREISIGNYVLTGGELPALVIADAVTRLVPGVVGNAQSLAQESLESGLLKYPQYTRPRAFEGIPVPSVLLGGDHGAIARWRQEQMEERTQRKRSDLWEKYLRSRGAGKNPPKAGSAPAGQLVDT